MTCACICDDCKVYCEACRYFCQLKEVAVTEVPTWNEIPFNPEDTPQQKADNFDAQILENRQAAIAKEEDKNK